MEHEHTFQRTGGEIVCRRCWVEADETRDDLLSNLRHSWSPRTWILAVSCAVHNHIVLAMGNMVLTANKPHKGPVCTYEHNGIWVTCARTGLAVAHYEPLGTPEMIGLGGNAWKIA